MKSTLQNHFEPLQAHIRLCLAIVLSILACYKLSAQNCDIDTQPPVIIECNDVTVDLVAGDCGALHQVPFTTMEPCPPSDVTVGVDAASLDADQGFVCPVGDASYWRIINTASEAIPSGLNMSAVQFKVFESINNPEVTVNVYRLDDGTITDDPELTLMATATQTIGNLFNEMAIIPLEASFDPGDVVAVEIVVPNAMMFGAIMGVYELEEENASLTNQFYVVSSSCDNETPTLLTEAFDDGYIALIELVGQKPSYALIKADDTEYELGDLLPAGSYSFSYYAVDQSGNASAPCSYDVTVNGFDDAIVAIVCNDDLQLSLDEECMMVVTADMILEGGPYGCLDNYVVEIQDSKGVNYGNTLTAENIGQDLKVRVTSPENNSCWGKIILEDKAPAPLDCVPGYTTCQGDTEPGAALSPSIPFRATVSPGNSELAATGMTTRSYRINVMGLNGASITDVGARINITHEAISDLTATVTSPSGVTRPLFMQPGTTCDEDNLNVTISSDATLTAMQLMDTCVMGEAYAASGTYQPVGDMSVYHGLDPVGEWIITISDVVDGNGGTINKVELIIDQENGTIPFPTTNDIDYVQIDNQKYRVTGLDACGPTVIRYNDAYEEQDCTSEFDNVILRSWTAEDEQGNVTTTCVQRIYVYRTGLEALIFPPDYDDLEEPSLSCSIFGDSIPTTETTGDINGDICKVLQVFPHEDIRIDICDKSYKILRKFKVVQWCTNEVVEHTQIIKVLDKEGPTFEPMMDDTVSTHEFECVVDYYPPMPQMVMDCSDDVTFTLKYLSSDGGDIPTSSDVLYYEENVKKDTRGNYYIEDLPVGDTWIRWILTDECGNHSYAHFTVKVRDLVQPVAVCDEFTIVSVGGNGYVDLYAESIDDGSHDNCELRSYEVRKMSPPRDRCSIPGNTSYGEFVRFCCAEIGEGPILVELKVEDIYGNSNTCMVEVDVQDKLPPYITDCPKDITLDCQSDYTDLDVTGRAEGVDNCEVADISYEDKGSIDKCGVGIITRTWTITDIQGLKNTCVQIITLEDMFPFDGEDDIRWPRNYEATTCNTNLDPENLPAANDYPDYDDDECSLISSTYKDKKFLFVDGSCEKILRTWTVINWCQYDEDNPQEGVGIWTYVQVIKLKNENPPVASNCEDMTVDIFGACEGEVEITLELEDDCTPLEDLLVQYDIDLYGDGVFDPDFSGESYIMKETLPIGTHKVTWRYEDICGNIDWCYFDLTVRDGKKPTPYCLTEIVTAVMNSNGSIDIWAKDFDLESYDNCTPIDKLKFSFSADTLDVSRIFDCSDIPDGEQQTIPLELWVTDEEGNQDYCDIRINVQDNEADFCDAEDGNNLTIKGTVKTSKGKSIKGAAVTAINMTTNEPYKQSLSDKEGKYRLNELVKDKSYQIVSKMEDAPDNGVNTLDLVLIQRHILKLKEFDNPYDLIAADANNDSKVKASDLLAIRKVILGLSSSFPNGQVSWEFIPEAYKFDDVSNPWPYNNYIQMDNMQHSATYQNLIGIKIGDVDNSAQLNGEREVQSRSQNVLSMRIDAQEYEAGDVVEVPVYAVQEGLSGYQFTLEAAGLEMQDVIAGQADVTMDNFGVFDGKVTTSWHTDDAIDTYLDEPLFTIEYVATKDGSTDDIQVSSSVTKAVAYDSELKTMNVEISTRSEEGAYDTFTLFQNRPNPFTSSTRIDFYLPKPTEVKLNVYDVTGKVLLRKSGTFKQGKQSFDILDGELTTSGMLYYEVVAGDERATMKMLNIE